MSVKGLHLLDAQGHMLFTVTFLGMQWGALVNVTVKTPSRSTASTLSASISQGSVTVRLNEPLGLSCRLQTPFANDPDAVWYVC